MRPHRFLENSLELTWSQKGLRRRFPSGCWLWATGWNWPDHRRDYDGLYFLSCYFHFHAGIDLITEGITTKLKGDCKRKLLGWNWPDHRRDYDHKVMKPLASTSGRAGIDLITEGITTHLHESEAGIANLAGIDLITEGITTNRPFRWCTCPVRLELTWSQKGLRHRYDHHCKPHNRAGIDLITEGITTTSAGSSRDSIAQGWNWPDHRRDYDSTNSISSSILSCPAGIDLITEGITTHNNRSRRCAHTRWNWPDHRRDYDVKLKGVVKELNS